MEKAKRHCRSAWIHLPDPAPRNPRNTADLKILRSCVIRRIPNVTHQNIRRFMERVPLVLAEALCLPYKPQSPDLKRRTKTGCIESRHGLSLKRIFDPQHNESKPPRQDVDPSNRARSKEPSLDGPGARTVRFRCSNLLPVLRKTFVLIGAYEYTG